jgi:DNA-binding transcriptional regulator YhcF (GntR family)
MTAKGRGLPKWARVAAAVRGQIADGALRPGEPAPSGAALSRVTGYSTLTCRRALRALVADGVLVAGPSRNARPRVAGGPQARAERDLAAAARALSAGLAARRRASGLTQPELARHAGVSVTTVGHAETGRLWQSRRFWERVDAVLGAHGDLLRLHDAYREAGAESSAEIAGRTGTPGIAGGAGVTRGSGVLAPSEHGPPGEARFPAGAGPGCSAGHPPGAHERAVLSCVTIVWSNGTVTTVHPPDATSPALSLPEASPPEAPLLGTLPPEASLPGAPSPGALPG